MSVYTSVSLDTETPLHSFVLVYLSSYPPLIPLKMSWLEFAPSSHGSFDPVHVSVL